MSQIVSNTSGKIKGLIIFMLLIGTALLVMNYVRGDETPIWAICIPWGIGLLFSFTLKKVTYQKDAITTLYSITRIVKRLDTSNIATLQIVWNEKSTTDYMGISKQTRMIVIRDSHKKPLHIVHEGLQEQFEEILVLLQEGFKEKWLVDDLNA